MMVVFLMMGFLECILVMEGVDLGLKIPAILPLSIVEFITMVTKVVTAEEVDRGLKI